MYRLSRIFPAPFKRRIWGVFSTIGLEVQIRPPKPKKQFIQREWLQIQAGPLTGLNLWLYESQRTFREGNYDSFLYKLLEERGIALTKGVVWDVGAHIGYHTLAFANLTGPNGRVVAFEPNPSNYNWLLQHLTANPHLAGRIEAKAVALTNIVGEQLFHCSVTEKNSDLGYLDNSGIPADRIRREVYESLETVTVSVTTGDYLVADGQCAPTFMKIDVEGAEMLVLEGSRQTLVANKPVLLIEVHSIQSMFLVEKFLLQLGYSLSIFDDPNRKSSSRTFLLAKA